LSPRNKDLLMIQEAIFISSVFLCPLPYQQGTQLENR